MAEPNLFGPAYSTFTRSCRLAMEEKGVDYDLVEVDILQGMPPEQYKRHPFGKVPAFEHDGMALYETCAVERYVDEAFDGPALQPDDPRERARMTQICAVIDNYAYSPTVGQLVIQRLVTPLMGGTPDESAIEAAMPQVKTAMLALEALAGDGPWLVGDRVTLADFHVAPVFDYFQMTPESASIRESTPKLNRWWERMSARESVKKTAPQLG